MPPSPPSGAVRSQRSASPVSNGWGFVSEPELDRLTAAARTSFDAAERDAALARLHGRLVEEACLLWVIHYMSPRAISQRTGGHAAPNGFYVDGSRPDIAAG